MRILITILFILTTFFVVNAQVPTSFRGTLNIYQSSGTAPNYEIRGIFNDTQSAYTSDSVDVGDVIYLLDGSNCVALTVSSIISTSGGVIRANVNDADTILSSAPLGNAAIMELTPNFSFPTYVDGISDDLLSCIQTHYALLVDGIDIPEPSQSGNTQDTITQNSHGFTVLDPLFVNSSGTWILSNVSDEDSVHMGIVTEIINSNTFIITYSGITEQTAHGYTIGSVYYVQDDGTYATTSPTNLINDIAFYVVSANKLFITEQRPVLPSTDLNGIYTGNGYIQSGTIAYTDNFQIKDSLDRFIFSINPENDNMSLSGDSMQLVFETGLGLTLTDNNTPKQGLKYAASGYVTDPQSLADKEYVDDAIATNGIQQLDTFTIVSNMLRASLSSDGVAFKSVDLSPYVNVANDLSFSGASSPVTLNSSTGTGVTITGSGINTLSATSGNITITGTEVDGSITNEIQQIDTFSLSGTTLSASLSSDGVAAKTVNLSGLLSGYPTGSGTSGYVARWTGTSALGTGVLRDDGTLLSSGGVTVTGYSFYDYATGAWRLPVGTTAQRPTGQAGASRYNSTLGYAETHNGSAWLQSDFPVGTTSQLLRFNGTSWVNSGSGLTWDGSRTLTVNGGGSGTFLYIGSPGFNFYHDAVSTGGNLLFRVSSTATMSWPQGNSNGFIFNPASNTETTTSVIRSSTGRQVTNGNLIDMATQINMTGSGSYNAFNIVQTVQPDASNNISAGNFGGINLQQTFSAVTGIAGNKAVEYYGIHVRPSIYRDAAEADNSFGIYINPTLTGAGSAAGWRGISNNTTSGRFINSENAAISHHQGNFGIGSGTTTPAYTLDVGGTGAIRIPIGTTAQRPSTATGIIRVNSDSIKIEWYNGSAWKSLTSGVGTIGTMSSWTLAGTSGTPQTVSDGQTATIAAGYGMTTTATATRTVIVSADSIQLATQHDLTQVPTIYTADNSTPISEDRTVNLDENGTLTVYQEDSGSGDITSLEFGKGAPGGADFLFSSSKGSDIIEVRAVTSATEASQFISLDNQFGANGQTIAIGNRVVQLSASTTTGGSKTASILINATNTSDMYAWINGYHRNVFNTESSTGYQDFQINTTSRFKILPDSVRINAESLRLKALPISNTQSQYQVGVKADGTGQVVARQYGSHAVLYAPTGNPTCTSTTYKTVTGFGTAGLKSSDFALTDSTATYSGLTGKRFLISYSVQFTPTVTGADVTPELRVTQNGSVDSASRVGKMVTTAISDYIAGQCILSLTNGDVIKLSAGGMDGSIQFENGSITITEI